MTILSLLRVNVIIAIIAAAVTAGVMSGLSIVESIEMLVGGVGGGANTALSYILLGAFAIAISYTGITTILVNYLIKKLTGKRTMMVLAIAGVASLSQNVVPVHIAFIPILIPPLLKLFDRMRLDRRAVATALTFGFKAPYMTIPAGFGLLSHGIIVDSMAENGITLIVKQTALSMIIPGLGMVVALIVQIYTDNLIIGALTGLILMFLFIVVPFRNGDKIVAEGIGMMGTIAFVMLVAAGYGEILKVTGAVSALIEVSSGFLDQSHQVFIAFILLIVGLVVTIGIGSSFGTIPIIAALYVPICVAAGFSPMATAALIGTAVRLVSCQ